MLKANLNPLRANCYSSSEKVVMSKLFNPILLLTASSLLILQIVNNSFGQNISATITLDPSEKKATITGKFKDPDDIANRRHLPFFKEYAGIDKLGERITGLTLADGDGRDVDYRQLIPGEFLAGRSFVNWHYLVDVRPINPSASAHVSWIDKDTGIVFIDDLLPQLSAGDAQMTADLKFELPKGWQIYTTEKTKDGFAFEGVNVEKATFLVGRNLRERTINIGSVPIKFIFDSAWQFSDDEALTTAKEIYNSYHQLFGADPAQQIQLAVIKFPVTVGPGNWEANTLRSSVTILSSDMPFKTQSLQRLHEQLRHEIFHLWLPNGINLVGKFDWFYEGFALYLSLKNGVLLNRIRFEDFLDTLSRAHTIDSFQNSKLSLIEASQKRWTGGNTIVYARGMIAAFLCDLAMLDKSRGKKNVAGVLKEIFDKYHDQEKSADGTEAVINVLQRHSELRPIIEKYIKGNSTVDWTRDLLAAGLVAKETNSVTVLKTIDNPNGLLKALLDRLGYNSWRKLGTNSR